MATSARAVAASASGADPTTRLRESPSSSNPCCISARCPAPATNQHGMFQAAQRRAAGAARRRPGSPDHSTAPTGSASTMAAAPAAAARSATPSMRVSDPRKGPDCIRSSALPAATDCALVDQPDDVNASTECERARRGPPISPAPTIATRDIPGHFIGTSQAGQRAEGRGWDPLLLSCLRYRFRVG